MQVDQSIFKAYDIRGIYPDQLNEEVAYGIGRAFATLLIKENPGKELKVGVGADMRLSSPSLKERVIAGLIDSGVNVDDIGLVSTPTFYYGIAKFGYDGGLQISASHNPKQWNGVKVVRRNGTSVSKNSGIMDLRDMVAADNFAPLPEQPGLLGSNENIQLGLVKDQSKLVDVSKIGKFKIAIDVANAMGALDMAALFAHLPQIETIKMNFDLDGNFPAHEADPMKLENTEQIRAKVVAEKCDLGIAVDGDADRYFFVDEKGEMLPQAVLRGIMAQIELKEHPGAKVAYDIRPGRITQDMIDEYHGQAVVTPVGHSLIKEVMIKENAIFGGESSGHYFYKLDYGTFEAPIILVLKLLKYISEQAKPFSEIIAPFKRYVHSGEISVKVASQDEVAGKIAAVQEAFKDGKQNMLDGLSVEYPDFWFNLRASNTEPVIRFALEARDQKTMEQQREKVMKLLK